MAILDGLHPYPTGWYAVAFSSDLAPGDVKTVRYFDQEIVLFRTATGEAVAVDPYCPHLGAHLGHGGTIEGDTLTCPFHGWKFDAEGDCIAVPGCEKIPKGAALKRLSIVEQDDVVCVFHACDGSDAEPFPFPALGLDGFTDSQLVTWTLRTHPQEICENTVDMAHLKPVHSVDGAHVIDKPVIEGSYMNVVLEFNAPGDLIGMPGEDNHVQLDVILNGLGRIVSRTHVVNRGVRARQAIYATPIDGEHMHLRGVVNTMKTDDPEFTASLADLFYQSFVHDFAKDFPIWENKRYLERPRLSAADGPIGLYRKWSRQFYPSGHKPAQAHEPAPKHKLPLLAAMLHRVRELVDARRSAPASASPPARPTTTAGATSTPIKPPEPTQRVTSVAEYFDTLDQRFVPAGSAGVDAVFQWHLTGDEDVHRYAVVSDGSMALHDGEHDSPTVTIAMDAADYVRMVNREIDGAWAFTSGRAKLQGSLPMAMKMRKIFPQ
jgi:nitrite reductase/ring-hydroxylating ferredoxin subunit/putative sterol carrier protein